MNKRYILEIATREIEKCPIALAVQITLTHTLNAKHKWKQKLAGVWGV